MTDQPRWSEALTFPCDFEFKAFGPNEDSFLRDVTAGVSATLPVSREAVRVRASSRGAYACVTVLVRVHNPQQIEAIYRALQGVPGLRYLL